MKGSQPKNLRSRKRRLLGFLSDHENFLGSNTAHEKRRSMHRPDTGFEVSIAKSLYDSGKRQDRFITDEQTTR